MGLLTGSISLSRYRLVGSKLEKLPLGRLNKRIQAYQIGPVRVRGVSQEEKAGWVLPSGIEDEDLGSDDYWDLSHCEIDDGFVLRIRIERRRVSTELLQLVLRQKIEELESKRDKPLGRSQKKTVKDEVYEDLMKQALPQITYIDGFWKQDGEVYIFSTSKKAREIFVSLFHKTFGEPMGARLVLTSLPLSTEDAESIPLDGMRKIEPVLYAN